MRIRNVAAAEAGPLVPGLAALLVDAVASGAGVNFMAGFRQDEAEAFWRKALAGLAAGDRLLLVAEEDGEVIGTVMCLFMPQPNQPYRAEVSKMLVHTRARRRGVGAALMRAVEDAALAAGKTLLMLDTETGSAGDRLYRRMGWTPFGTVPGMAYTPDGRLTDATFFYRQLAPNPVWQGRT
jgi:GNAT superfamily N-acetyltransferase